MRENFTYGSVGGLVEQSLILPGRHCAAAPHRLRCFANWRRSVKLIGNSNSGVSPRRRPPRNPLAASTDLIDFIWATIIAVTIVFAYALFFACRKRLDQRRYAQWLCPTCGEPFGQQQSGRWSARIDPVPRNPKPNRGPRLYCRHCDFFYCFYPNGELCQGELSRSAKRRVKASR